MKSPRAPQRRELAPMPRVALQRWELARCGCRCRRDRWGALGDAGRSIRCYVGTGGLLARRLLFREFLLQAVYVIDARTDLLKRRGVVCIRPRACKKVSSHKADLPRAGDIPSFAFSTHNVPSTANHLRRSQCCRYRRAARKRASLVFPGSRRSWSTSPWSDARALDGSKGT
jgi:hypothetical protein